MENETPNEKWFEQHAAEIENVLSPSEQKLDTIIPNSPFITDLQTLLSEEFPPIEWLVDRLVPDKSLVALSGLPGNYKSWITQHLAICTANGIPLFNHFSTTQGSVLIIDKENHDSLLQRRFKLLGAVATLPIYFLNCEFFIENNSLMDELCDLIQKARIRLIIIDSLIRIYSKKDENSSNDMAEVFRQLRRFQVAGATVVFTHHHRKQSIFSKNTPAESMRGSSDILASVDVHLAVDVVEEVIKISQTKLRQDVALKPFNLKFEASQTEATLVYLGEAEEEKEKVVQAGGDILELLDEGETTRAELIERFKGVYGTKTIDGALKAFTSEEVIIRIGERGKKFYRKTGAEPDGSLFKSDSQNSSTNI